MSRFKRALVPALPWTAETYAVMSTAQEHGWTIKSGGDSLLDMPIIKGGCYSVKEVKAIATYIATACNKYPALRAKNARLRKALNGLFKHCAMVHKHWGEGANTEAAGAAIREARAAARVK